MNERYNVPLDEIAFIHDADTLSKKAALFKAVNAGRVRVLIGSTSKLGTGVNVQKRLVALHHMDQPWKPAELEQREGRILRQGNIYPEVFIFHYVTERSFDGYMLQTLESKARFISQIMAGEVTARTAEDVGDMVLTVAQVKAIASGNPLVQQRIELEVKLVKLDRLRAAFYNNRAQMRADLEELPQAILAQEAEINGHENAIKARQPLKEDSFFMPLKKKLGESESATFDKRERAGAQVRYLTELLMDHLRRGVGRGGVTEEVGTYRGFKVYIHVSGNASFAGITTLFNFQSEIHLRAEDGSTCYVAQIGESNVGITQSIDYQLRHIEDRLEQSRAQLEMLKHRLEVVQAEAHKPWTHASEYRRLRREYERMGQSLQAEGIEIESNTTFIAEETGEEEIDDAISDVSVTNIAQTQDGTEDFGTRANPFTGLEDWTIAVDEPLNTETDWSTADQDDIESNGFGTLSFDFAAPADVEVVEEAQGEMDIFLTPPSNKDSSNEGFERKTPNSDSTLKNSSLNSKRNSAKRKRGLQNNSNTRSSSEQTNLFW